jgi:hypothetical protein
MELIAAQGASTETAHCITFFHNKMYSGPDSSLCHKSYQKHNQTTLYITLGPHKHRSNKQVTTQYHSPVYIQVPQFMDSLNACIICTHYVAHC